MNISGIGLVFNRGRGVRSLETALKEGWVHPEDSMYSLPADTLKDKSVLKEMRRADDFSKMASLAAYDAFVDSGLGDEAKRSLGIILATAFGPHVTTFRFLDDILDYGDANVSPTIFSHSVHNAAASYIALLLGARGPTLTVTQFAHSFHQALIIAQSWLEEKRCEYILVGSADQCGAVMKYICSQKLLLSSDGRIKPFLFAHTPEAVPGEGSAFFLVSNKEMPKAYASISARRDDVLGEPDMYILDCDGMAGSEEEYLVLREKRALLSSYAPIFGSMLTASSFSCAAAALMLKNQQYYAAPVQESPHRLNLCKAHQSAEIKNINCLRYGCKSEKIEFFLQH